MIAELSSAEKMHISQCVWEEPSLKRAAVRISNENPRAAFVNVARSDALWLWSRTPEHWSNVRQLRKELQPHVKDHPYVPAIDRIKILTSQLEEAKERLEAVPKKDTMGFTRMSTETRNLLFALQQEQRVLNKELEATHQSDSPVGRAEAGLEESGELEKKFEELGIEVPGSSRSLSH